MTDTGDTPTQATDTTPRPRRGAAIAAIVGPAVWWTFTYIVWNIGEQPKLWLVSAEHWAPWRWIFAASTHLTDVHLALNCAVWIALATYTIGRLRIPPGWLIGVTLAANIPAIAAQLLVDPRTDAYYGGASPSVFALAAIAAAATLSSNATSAAARGATWVAVTIIAAGQVIEAEAQLAGRSSTSAAAHLTAAAFGAAAYWRHRRSSAQPDNPERCDTRT